MRSDLVLCAQNNQKMFRFKMAAKNNFRFAKKSCDHTLKNHFPKGFFNKIWLKVEEHECIYIFEIKSLKKIFCLKMTAKTNFVTLRNNAHLC